MLWAWKSHDKDLNFNDMLQHLSEDGYLTFVQNQFSKHELKIITNDHNLHTIYRTLSNTVHGKITTFETSLEDRFLHNKTHWTEHLQLVERVLDELIGIFLRRFDLETELTKKIPAFKKLSGGKA